MIWNLTLLVEFKLLSDSNSGRYGFLEYRDIYVSRYKGPYLAYGTSDDKIR